MKYIDAEKLQKEIERQIMGIIKKQDANPDIPKHRWYLYEGMKEAFNDIGGFIDSLQQEQPEVFDSAAFQKGVQEGRRLEREDAEHLRDSTKKNSEDLEEAAEEYASRYDAWNDDQDIAEYAFKAGAEWMKKQFEKEES